MGRTLLVIGLSVAMEAAAFSTPLVHAHLDEHQQSHGGHHGIHTHIASNPLQHTHVPSAGQLPGTPGVHADETRQQVTAVTLFVALEAGAMVALSLPPAPVVVGPSWDSAGRRRPEVVRSHGPPAGIRSAPRAPPVFPPAI